MKFFIPIICASQLGASLLMAAPEDKTDPTEADFKAIQGVWNVVKVEVAGRDATGSFLGSKKKKQKITFQFSNNKFRSNFQPNEESNESFVLNAKTNPKQFDLLAPDRNAKFEGIYQLEGDT